MNGSAPNSPATGSQTSVRQKLRPNLLIESIDCRVSSNPMAHTISTRTSANAPVPSLNPRSPVLPRLRAIPAPLRDLDLRQRRHLELHDRVRQRRVTELGAELLAVAQRPLHEIDHGLRLVL